ncbi:MAG: glutamate racemase, partial [Candidatus Omnitrophica bacterium]|nr:glutamate racemase [Candidatus Omnitrophota bacterium]
MLDVGSGLGGLSIWAKEHWAKEVVGIDINAESIKRARKIVKGKGLKIRYEKGDATRIRFEDSRFGVVTSGRTLEFLTANARRTALKEIQRVLKTNGTILIVIHDDEGKRAGKDGRMAWPDGYWDDGAWESELKDAGFANVHIDTAWPTEEEAPAKIIYATKFATRRHYTGLGAMDADAVPYPSSGDRSQLQYSSEKAWRAETPIGIVDSGLGGLSVAEALRRSMPNEKLLCLIDTANFPYGSKSEEELIKIKDDNMNLLSSQGVKAIVIACGTLSTVGYTDRSLYTLPIVNFVDALAKEAVRSSRTLNIGVLATQATVQTGVFQRRIESLGIGIRVTAVGCSDKFVKLVEEGKTNTPQARKVVEEEIAMLKINGVDTIVLGCSHYTFLRDVIQDVVGKDVKIISSEQAIANEVAELLKTKGLLAAHPARAGPPVFVTGPHSGLQDKISFMLGAAAKYQIIPYKTAKVSRGS